MWIRCITRSQQARLTVAMLLLAVVAAATPHAVQAEAQRQRHAIAMHGEPELAPGFSHLPFVNPDAPKGGRLVSGQQGTFDSLNALVVRGVAPDLVQRYVLQSLLYRTPDEPFTAYGLLARAISMPEDRSEVTFFLDPAARFSDGKPVTATDVVFSLDMLRKHGKPFHRRSLERVASIETPDALTVRLVFGPGSDRELPLIIGAVPIFAKHATNPVTFPETSFTPLTGSGPYIVADVRPGESITLNRRQDFWAADHPLMRGQFNLDVIRNEYFRDSNTLFEAFKAGLSDVRVESDPGRWVSGYDIPAVHQGRIMQRSVRLGLPKGLSAFVFNTRKEIFRDAPVREALALVFDFEWVNRNLYSGVYRRSDSLFADSDLAAAGRPMNDREAALLERIGGTLPPALRDGSWSPPQSDGSGRDRDHARRAFDLLQQAGYQLENGVMTRRGQALSFEISVSSRPQERLALNYAKSLQRIGVEARIRLVDDVQYWRRLAAFDFDMVQWLWPVSASPGTEQSNRWGSEAADRQGSLNLAGVRSPAIDSVVRGMLQAHAREDFVAATRLLDRLVMAGSYVVPLFYLPETWIAHQKGVMFPPVQARFGLAFEALWRDPQPSTGSIQPAN